MEGKKTLIRNMVWPHPLFICHWSGFRKDVPLMLAL